jgi:hypothetical protein
MDKPKDKRPPHYISVRSVLILSTPLHSGIHGGLISLRIVSGGGSYKHGNKPSGSVK